MKRTLPLIVVGVLVLGACSSSSDSSKSSSSSSSSSATTSQAAGAALITIKGFAFHPPATAKAGTITIKNEDSTRHTFHPDKDGDFQAIEINGGESGETDLSPGTHSFHCNIHSSMKGTIEVTA